MEKSDFYTLKGYGFKDHEMITNAMEDYIEMIYRSTQINHVVSVKDLSVLLNVQPSSVSKMIGKLKMLGLVYFVPYGEITLTVEGMKKGAFLLWRHNILEQFLRELNQDDFKLEQVEKIEHFVDEVTLRNIAKHLSKEHDY